MFNDTTTDDPPLANTCGATRYQVCPDGTAGSLHAYWTYFTGGMLYKDWAHMEDPAVSHGGLPGGLFRICQVNPPAKIQRMAIQCRASETVAEENRSEGSWYQYSM